MTREQFSKKWQNYWYYYKIHTIVGIILIITLSVLITQCASRIEPDLEVVFVSKTVILSQERVEDIENTLAKFTDDVNHDGHKMVTLNYMYLGDGQDGQTAYATQMKLMANVAGTTTAIYMTDDNYFGQLNKEGGMFNNLRNIDTSAPDAKNVKISRLPDLKLTEMPDSYYNMNVSIRAFEGTVLDKSSNIPNYNNAVKVLKALLKNGGLIK